MLTAPIDNVDIEHRVAADLQNDSILDVPIESLLRHVQTIWSYGKIGHDVVAVRIRGGRAVLACVGPRQLHLRVWHDRACLVRNYAGHLRGRNLAPARSARKEQR